MEDKKVIESIKNIMEYCGSRKIECEDWDLRIIKK